MQSRRRRTKSGPVVDNGNRVGGAAPGRVREGGTNRAQLGGMGERCKLPHGGLGRSPRSQRFLRCKTLQNYAKKCNTNIVHKELNSPSIHLENTTLRQRAFACHIFNLAFLADPACLSSMKQMHGRKNNF